MISVIIPVYNVEKYLKRCIDSIISQSYKNLEIILIDDGSTDKSVEICDYYAQLDSRIIVVHKTNGGLSSARNKGLEIAQGEFISFVDSDDWIGKDTYLNVVKVFNNNKVDMCSFSYVAVTDELLDDKDDTTSHKEVEIIGNGLLLDKFFGYKTKDNFFSCCTNVYTKRIIGESRFLEGKTCEDILFNFIVFNKIEKVAIIDTIYYYYFQRLSSISNGKLKSSNFNALEIWDSVSSLNKDLNRIKEIKYNYTKSVIALLFRATIFGIDDTVSNFKHMRKKLLNHVRKYAFRLLFAKNYDIKKKCGLLIMCLNYHLAGVIGKKILIHS